MTMPSKRKLVAMLIAAALFSPVSPFAAQEPEKPGTPTIHVSTELVLVNVVARDKKGNPVRDLKQGDFTLYEDAKKQQISTFDFEDVDQLPITAGPTVSAPAPGTLLHSTQKAPPTLHPPTPPPTLSSFHFSSLEP